MAINKTFYNYGENDTNTPVDAEFLNSLVSIANLNETKVQHITADENSTTFDGTPVYHGESNEFVITDEKGNTTNTSETSLESEE